jgi:hypothetical protein
MTLISCRWMRLDTALCLAVCTYDDIEGNGICPAMWLHGQCPIADEVLG